MTAIERTTRCPNADDNDLELNRDTDLGSEDSTRSDMVLTGAPATSSTPVGQGDESGSGADDDRARN